MIVTLTVLLAVAIVALSGTVAALVWLFHVEHRETTQRERHFVNAIIAGRATGAISETRAMTELSKASDEREPRHRRAGNVGRVDRDHERALIAAGATDDRGEPVHPVGFDD